MENIKKEYKYDVVFSFAGAQREYVESVNKHLKNYNVSVFYDNDNETDLWGKNLYRYLDDLYSKQARYCIIFISKEYAERKWTIHESISAQERSFNDYDMENYQEYILPVRFDSTDIPGIRSITGYLDATQLTPEQLAEKIAVKVGKCGRLPQESLSLDTVYQNIASILTEYEEQEKYFICRQTDNTIQILNRQDEATIWATIQFWGNYIYLFIGERSLEENPALILTVARSMLRIINFSHYFGQSVQYEVGMSDFKQIFRDGIKKLLEVQYDSI